MLDQPLAGPYYRVAEPDWADPVDATFAARPPGQRWNPTGLDCLYLNGDEVTARANVGRLFVGLPYGPEDLDPATAPLLIEVELPDGQAVDAFTAAGIEDLGLPSGYPVDAAGVVVPHRVCQPLGQAAADAGFDGVAARSAATGGRRELAWFPAGRNARVGVRRAFDEWW